ncbi:tfp pilus assembly protein [Chrysochromulina tobinii]|uniref:Tfp pilus assembly protein n=1 Tax=Chrysochromulina tobinii TaxID=1460289 RepID=A0A0M0J557_9EUKA|nr:tfp pilus assembly protein [Chrysochromulina tobinii]|eukprot:KOO21348.1 tfp pilus assembly protein [Chrysochromulina sp. CCMP291]
MEMRYNATSNAESHVQTRVVIVYCASEGSQSDVSGLTLKCTPSERRVWVENGKGAGGRKIAFSSTFDGVVDGSTAEGAAQALYDEGFAKAVEAVTADKLTLGEGKLLLVDASDVSFAEASSSLLSSTLCHHSHAMLLKCLAKPSARPTVADTALLPRLLAPSFFDAGASARLVLHVPPSASPTIVDMLRSAQAAAKAAKSKKQSDSDRSGAVIELLQGRLAEPKPPPSAEQVVSSLRAIMGDTAAVEKQLELAKRELNDLEAKIESARAAAGASTSEAGTAEGASGASSEMDATLAAWEAEEEEMATQLAAERTEAVAIMTALQTQENGGKGGEGDGMKHDLDEQVKRYEAAVESAWSDVQRAKRQAEETEARFDRAREFARRTAVEKEEMENTLLDVASDLENLARNYRQHGSPAMAVPLYVSALAIFEKTLGPEHPQVASNLVNLGNAFCDQQKHIEAVPVYLRALAIDEKALGHDHPEVAMDLSNLGIAYRALGRPDIATGLFERAHKLMLAAVGPDDPKTQAILRNLG